MSMKRRTFLIGSVTGVSLFAVAACTPDTPTPTPTVPVVPSKVPQPIAFHRTNWTADPFSYGAFSYQAVDSDPRDRATLSEPVDDRLFFAGEAVSQEEPGTVYGARDSGLRAAIAVAEVAEPGERIAVVGAGIAGASAARRLSDEGFNVVVVEGRERAGGRIHSFDDGEWPFPVELGAAIVQTPGATIAAELEMLGVELVPAPVRQEVRTRTGVQIENTTTASQAVADAIAWAAEQSRDSSVAEALRDSGAGDLDASPGEGGVSDALRLTHFLQADISAQRAADPDDLSAWFTSLPDVQEDPDGQEDGADEADTDRKLVIGGYQSLVEDALHDVDVLPSSTVTSVTTTERGVSLRLARGDSLSADRVIVTVPLGVLKAGSIEFTPALPFSHRGAIDALGVGRQEKLLLRFAKPFWSSTATRWDVMDASTDFPLWVNLLPITGEPMLVAVFGGDTADRLSESSDAELLEAALSSLEPFIDPDLVESEPTD